MRRQAIIIECSAVAGQDRLPGAILDAQAWEQYLLSNRGGAWEPSEIEVISNPTSRQLLTQIDAMSGDYGFIAFSGHGSVVAQTTMLCVQGGVVSEQQLTKNRCSRVALILDSCRGVEQTRTLAKAQILLDSIVDRGAYRRLFDAAIQRSEQGACRLYGCDFDQSAHEEAAGGNFTQGLIQAGRSWTGQGVLPLNQAFETAASSVRRKNPQQTPTSMMGRRMHHFPFAVET